MLKGDYYWTWERAMKHALFLATRYPDQHYRVYKTGSSLGWTVTYADSREK